MPVAGSVTVTVIDGPPVTAGPDQVFCVDPVQLEAAIVGEDPPACGNDSGIHTYCFDNNEVIEVTFCPDTPGDGITLMSIEFLAGELDGWNDNITFYNGDSPAAPWLGNTWNTNLACGEFLTFR